MSTVYILTDFGTADTYVSQMKGVLLSAAPPNTALVDLTHEVRPGSVKEGAFHLYASQGAIPPGSVVLAVVDPGVGTSRRGVICSSGGILYVGPDNGLFGLLDIREAWVLPPVPEGSSSTFHGRDLFAPAAARLVTQPGWVRFLEKMEVVEMEELAIRPPVETEGGQKVTVAHVDGFGNVLLWMDSGKYGNFRPTEAALPDGSVRGVVPADTYGENRGVLFLRGSQGCMELAVSGGSAADLLGLSPGDRILLRENE
ncbi:MAG: SAM-dependent chlorinase/fluorinase [Candidatus Aegiribacteria sp.]